MQQGSLVPSVTSMVAEVFFEGLTEEQPHTLPLVDQLPSFVSADMLSAAVVGSTVAAALNWDTPFIAGAPLAMELKPVFSTTSALSFAASVEALGYNDPYATLPDIQVNVFGALKLDSGFSFSSLALASSLEVPSSFEQMLQLELADMGGRHEAGVIWETLSLLPAVGVSASTQTSFGLSVLETVQIEWGDALRTAPLRTAVASDEDEWVLAAAYSLASVFAINSHASLAFEAETLWSILHGPLHTAAFLQGEAQFPPASSFLVPHPS